MTNLRRFKTQKFADDNFKFNEIGRNFSKWVGKNVEKGEIAHYECFQKTCIVNK